MRWPWWCCCSPTYAVLLVRTHLPRPPRPRRSLPCGLREGGGQGRGVLMSQRGLMAGRRTWMFSKHTQHFNSRSGSAQGCTRSQGGERGDGAGLWCAMVTAGHHSDPLGTAQRGPTAPFLPLLPHQEWGRGLVGLGHGTAGSPRPQAGHGAGTWGCPGSSGGAGAVQKQQQDGGGCKPCTAPARA